MTDRRFVLALCALLLALSVTPAMAEEYWWYRYGRWHHGAEWHAMHRGIYELNNRIAFSEADPEIDDGYKGRIISGARRDIRRLNATLYPAQWEWPTPCCYGRKPIHIR